MESDFELFVPIKRKFNEDYGISEKTEGFIIEEFKDYLNNGTVIFAIVDEKIIGYLSGIIEDNKYERFGYISEIFVSKDFRGKGVSTKLKDKFIEFLKSQKISLCRIDVNPNNSALEIYEKWGFKIDKYRLYYKF